MNLLTFFRKPDLLWVVGSLPPPPPRIAEQKSFSMLFTGCLPKKGLLPFLADFLLAFRSQHFLGNYSGRSNDACGYALQVLPGPHRESIFGRQRKSSYRVLMLCTHFSLEFHNLLQNRPQESCCHPQVQYSLSRDFLQLLLRSLRNLENHGAFFGDASKNFAAVPWRSLSPLPGMHCGYPTNTLQGPLNKLRQPWKDAVKTAGNILRKSSETPYWL